MQPFSCYSDILGNILRWHDILFYYYYMGRASSSSQTVDKALLLQGFAIVGTAFLI